MASVFFKVELLIQGHQAVLPELDLVEQEDQFTHEISLSDDLDPQTNLGNGLFTYYLRKMLTPLLILSAQ
jgi:pre-mRNA-splicing factor CWC22